MALVHAVERTIRRHAMLTGGETVLVAVSGGADSVALLHILRELTPTFSLALFVLHVDHCLRAGRWDAEFVRPWASARIAGGGGARGGRPGFGGGGGAGRAPRWKRADRLGADRIDGHSAR